MQSKLIFLEVFTKDTGTAQSFYGALFGTQAFCLLPSYEVRTYFMPISSDGIDIHITQLLRDQPPRIVPYFAVDNLREWLDYLGRQGGELIVDPFAVNVSREFFDRFREKAADRLRKVDPDVSITDKLGDVALMLDPDRNPVGLMQLEDFVHYSYRWGKFRVPLTEEQLEDHAIALRLSQDLLFDEKGQQRASAT